MIKMLLLFWLISFGLLIWAGFPVDASAWSSTVITVIAYLSVYRV